MNFLIFPVPSYPYYFPVLLPSAWLSVVLKYRCQILFTTRSKLDEYCTLPLKEIEDMNALFQLTSVFYSEADTYRATVEKIIETVHSHTFAVELAAKLLENGISTPDFFWHGATIYQT